MSAPIRMKKKIIKILLEYVDVDEGHDESINLLALDIVNAFITDGWRKVKEGEDTE